MLSFFGNFFFTRFLWVFFILTVFGWWGIDTNSEELYIAFSFFLLIAVTVVVFRRILTLFFVQLVNYKYFRLLSGLLISINFLAGIVLELKKLTQLLSELIHLIRFYYCKLENYLARQLRLTAHMELCLRRSIRAGVRFLLHKGVAQRSFIYRRFHSFGAVNCSGLFSIRLHSSALKNKPYKELL